MKDKIIWLLLILTAAAGLLTPWACAKKKEEPEQAYTPQIMEALEGENPAEAKILASECIARVDIAGENVEYYGSGILWDGREGCLILVTAGHLLEKGEVLRVVFAGGWEGKALRVTKADTADVGFVEISLLTKEGEEGDGRKVNGPAIVSLHQRIFDTLDEKSSLFLIACSEDRAADLVEDASLIEKKLYREEFHSEVMILAGNSAAGMSGGGAFDGYGNLIGMVVGGKAEETAVLSMEEINEAYYELYEMRRDTEHYRA